MPPIQRMQQRDIEALEALFPDITEGQFEADYLEQLQNIRTVLVAVEKDEEGERTYFGYVSIHWTSDYTEFWRRNIPEIVDLQVAEPYRKQGIGSALVAACETLVREKGYTTLGTSIKQNDAAATRFYSELGYVLPDFGTAPHDDQTVHLIKSL
jgi:GNAT superfamily N-acetyltransferase